MAEEFAKGESGTLFFLQGTTPRHAPGSICTAPPCPPPLPGVMVGVPAGVTRTAPPQRQGWAPRRIACFSHYPDEDEVRACHHVVGVSPTVFRFRVVSAPWRSLGMPHQHFEWSFFHFLCDYNITWHLFLFIYKKAFLPQKLSMNQEKAFWR